MVISFIQSSLRLVQSRWPNRYQRLFLGGKIGKKVELTAHQGQRLTLCGDLRLRPTASHRNKLLNRRQTRLHGANNSHLATKVFYATRKLITTFTRIRQKIQSTPHFKMHHNITSHLCLSSAEFPSYQNVICICSSHLSCMLYVPSIWNDL
jgi:hypothetical protein